MAQGRKTGGRKPGTRNKFTGALKDMILQALSNKGGSAYLEIQAEKNPVAFMALVGRVLPLQVNDGGADPIVPTVVRHVYERGSIDGR